ncbi:hypothetical protein ABH931_007419 [Streptacidiphilus sp. MAP12-33]|uniref:hypothetical protein n=1 Tax=Streptacidiphilus sp. MAP12-33 TaxID=3156266 RepID=UPI0035153E27
MSPQFDLWNEEEGTVGKMAGRIIQLGCWVFIESLFRRAYVVDAEVSEVAGRASLDLEESRVDMGRVQYATFRLDGGHYAISQLEGLSHVEVWIERGKEADPLRVDGLLGVLGLEKASILYLVDAEGHWQKMAR